MVSTRQMTIVHSGTGDVPEQNLSESGPAKLTRNSINPTTNPAGKSSSSLCPPSKSTQFIDLPQEIIEKIFGYLNYKNICQLRFVCTRIDRICGHILNSTFQRLQHQLLDRFHNIKSKMPRRESARRNHHLACESDIIETLHMRLTLLQMSLGKHIERKHCYFFPGEILDEVLHILHYIKVTPKLARPYKVTDELFDLSTMAMEYFKEKIEPDLPEIAYFSTDFLEFSGNYGSSSSNKYLCMDPFAMEMDDSKERESVTSSDLMEDDRSVTETPQSNMVLRKGIRKIRQGMKRYNSQLTTLRQDVRSCRQKTNEQQKLMSDQQKQLAEQQKQLLEYATRMDEHDKKNEEISRKFSTLLQELNKCKTELQYWRSKSPAVPPFCSTCGAVINFYPEELEPLVHEEPNLEENVDNDVFPELLALPGTSADDVLPVLVEVPVPDLAPPPLQVVVGGASPSTKAGTKRKLEEAQSKESISKKSLRIKGRKRSKI